MPYLDPKDSDPVVTTRDGLTLFYPWRSFGRACLVPSEADARRLHKEHEKQITRASVIFIPVALGAVELILDYTSGWWTAMLVAVLYLCMFLLHVFWIRTRCRRIEAAEGGLADGNRRVAAEVVKLLQEEGAGTNLEHVDRVCALTAAVRRGRTNLVRAILKKSVDVNAKDTYGRTALMVAVGKGGADMPIRPQDHGAHVDDLDGGCETPPAEILRLLLGHGADVDARDLTGRTPLMIAAGAGSVDAVTLLLEHGADAKTVDRYGQTALVWAVRAGHADVAELLRAQGGKLTLPVAAMLGDTEAVRRLVEEGADPDQRDSAGRTALMIAVEKRHSDVAKVLLNGDVEVNAADKFGRTALMLAAREGLRDVVEMLLDEGAKATAKDGDGRSALQLATARGHKHVVDLLIEHGACG
ncbi:MAG: ankyrin repeat domain-containing protein [Thermodesulfobacteriota bacterium]